MQCRMVDLLALVAATAVTFALFRLHVLAAVAACPLIFGPLVGSLVGRSAEGAVAGFLAAVFWTLVALALALHLLLLAASMNAAMLGKERAALVLATIAYVSAAASSILGGYMGGRVARS